jgi:hypothetical protein
MAYPAQIEPHRAPPRAVPPRLAARPVAASPAPTFSPLEWSIIRQARVDGLSSLREPGRLRRFLSWLFGLNRTPRLASPRLETLRRTAVLSWHFGFSVPGDDVAEFIAPGFGSDQYELLVHSIRAAINPGPQRIH